MQHRFADFDHYFFIVQHFQRFSSQTFNNAAPWWFYLGALTLLTLPWAPWWLLGLRRSPGGATLERRHDVRALMLVWAAVVTLFFSVPHSKLVGYIIPALAPLACLGASLASRVTGPWLRLTAAVASVTCVGAALTAHYTQPKSNAALATELRAQHKPGEPVIFLENYYYDVAFYARLTDAVFVADAWLPSEVAKDSWRRELTDAESFVADAPAHHLLPTVGLAAMLCRSTVSSWIVGPYPPASDTKWLDPQGAAFNAGKTALWHIEPARPAMRTALGCSFSGREPQSLSPLQ
jgi:hypothetical protein